MANKPINSPLAGVVMTVAVLLSGYESLAADAPTADSALSEIHDRKQAVQNLESEIKRSITIFSDISSKFSEMNKSIIRTGIPKHMLADEHVKSLIAQMISIRQIEADLKNAKHPEQLASTHMELRRAVAEARSEIVITYDFHRQQLATPVVLESDTDLQGLRALADQSTKRLLQLVNA